MKGFRTTLLKLTIFVVVSLTLGSVVFGTLLGPSVGDTDNYHATFADVTGLRSGDTVRVSGVTVGQVDNVRLVDARHVDVEFSANRNQTLTMSTYAVVRYANLLGQRFLALTQDSKPGAPLPHGATIRQDHTRGALSLTALFNGFRPLFRALDADQINKFSREIIAILQGESGTIEDLFRQTAQLTSNLADRDQLFINVIDNLGGVLRSVAQHDIQLGQMVDSLDQLTRNLARQTPDIDRSIDTVNRLATAVNKLVSGLNGGDFSSLLVDVQRVAGVLADNTGPLNRVITAFPAAFHDFNRVTQYGNWVNAYPCSLSANIPIAPNLTGANIIAAIKGFLGPNANPATTAALNLLQLTLGPLLGGLNVPLPLTIPQGPLQTNPNTASAVCR